MISALLGFIAGILLTWPAFIVLVILGVLFEHNDCHGWAIFMGIVTALVSYFFFAIPFTTLLMYAGVYLIAGLLWSFWRYKRHADKIVEQYKNDDASAKKVALQYLHPSKMLGTITMWVIVWPFSMIENVAGDIINVIQTLITKVFRAVYNSIYNSAVKKLNGE
jgi:hypothetical protein